MTKTEQALQDTALTVADLRSEFGVLRKEVELRAKQLERVEEDFRERRRYWDKVWLALGVVLLSAFVNIAMKIIER